jgi:putative phosphoribosyl transferase
MNFVFRDRRHAGRELADALARYARVPDVLVLALPRGGVPVGYEVARTIGAPLDVFLVRKLGFPGNQEYAMGAIASGGVRVIDDELLGRVGISPAVVERVIQKEERELRRREYAYRGHLPPLELAGRTAILVDDGLATGSSMRAAVKAARGRGARRIVVATPVGPSDTVCELSRLADEVVCPSRPEPFLAVGRFYENFDQTEDAEVVALLEKARAGEMKPRVRPGAGVHGGTHA